MRPVSPKAARLGPKSDRRSLPDPKAAAPDGASTDKGLAKRGGRPAHELTAGMLVGGSLRAVPGAPRPEVRCREPPAGTFGPAVLIKKAEKFRNYVYTLIFRITGMQRAQPSELGVTAEGTSKDQAGLAEKRSAEYFEAWKRVAERDVHAIFATLPVCGPTIPDEMKEEAVDLIHRLTWWDTCEHMSDDEKIEACLANSEAMDEYALKLAEKAAAERCKLVLAASKRG